MGRRREKKKYGKLSIFFFLCRFCLGGRVWMLICLSSFPSFFLRTSTKVSNTKKKRKKAKYKIFLHQILYHISALFSFFISEINQFTSSFISLTFLIFCFHSYISIRNIWQLYIHRRRIISSYTHIQLFSVYIKTLSLIK